MPDLINSDLSPKKIVEDRGLGMISDEGTIQPIIDELIKNYPEEVQAFKNGKTKIIGFFVGQLMKRTKGKADPKMANKLIMQKLKS